MSEETKVPEELKDSNSPSYSSSLLRNTTLDGNEMSSNQISSIDSTMKGVGDESSWSYQQEETDNKYEYDHIKESKLLNKDVKQKDQDYNNNDNDQKDKNSSSYIPQEIDDSINNHESIQAKCNQNQQETNDYASSSSSSSSSQFHSQQSISHSNDVSVKKKPTSPKLSTSVATTSSNEPLSTVMKDHHDDHNVNRTEDIFKILESSVGTPAHHITTSVTPSSVVSIPKSNNSNSSYNSVPIHNHHHDRINHNSNISSDMDNGAMGRAKRVKRPVQHADETIETGTKRRKNKDFYDDDDDDLRLRRNGINIGGRGKRNEEDLPLALRTAIHQAREFPPIRLCDVVSKEADKKMALYAARSVVEVLRGGISDKTRLGIDKTTIECDINGLPLPSNAEINYCLDHLETRSDYIWDQIVELQRLQKRVSDGELDTELENIEATSVSSEIESQQQQQQQQSISSSQKNDITFERKCELILKNNKFRANESHSLAALNVIIDSGSLKNKQFGIISRLISNGRHLNLSQIYTSQRFSQVSTTLRTNLTAAILFNTSMKELDLIAEDMNYLSSHKEFIKMFRETTKQPRSFLVVNFSNPMESLYLDTDFKPIPQ